MSFGTRAAPDEGPDPRVTEEGEGATDCGLPALALREERFSLNAGLEAVAGFGAASLIAGSGGTRVMVFDEEAERGL